MPNVGDELHHFGWNACSAALCPYATHPHLERRYLVVPTLRTSRIYILDTKPDPYKPQLVKTVEADVIAERTGYSRLHTVHCGPDAIYLNGIGAADGGVPGGILRIDHNTFEPLGRWEIDRGPRSLAYDFWWHMGLDIAITSEWCTPELFENGPSLENIVAGNYGHKLHFWDLRRRRHQQELDLGSEHQMVLELRPSHDPTKTYGFVGVVVNNTDLSSSVWTWYLKDGKWDATKVIEIPAEAADPALLPEALKGLGAVPPLVTDIDCRWMTSSFMCLAGAPGNCANMTSQTPLTPNLPELLSWAASCARRRIPNPARWWARRKWWKSAETVTESM